MPYNRICISSGHGKYVRGASGIIDEVDEARRVVNEVADMLRTRDVEVVVFHDDTSHDQSTNLSTIVNFHNKQKRELDVSVHFNAYEQVEKPMGVEVLYFSQSALAGQISSSIAKVGFINRGPKYRDNLAFLRNTTMPSVLIETCFVDSETDVSIYRSHFMEVCDAIADVLGGEDTIGQPPPPSEAHNLSGKCSHFGGPDDTGVSASEGLAFIYDYMQAPHLFLPYQPNGTSGLARRLNPNVHYLAARWDYKETPKETLLQTVALVRSIKTGIALQAFPADWGPNENTGRIADLSPGLMMDLGIETDDVVEVIFPYDTSV